MQIVKHPTVAQLKAMGSLQEVPATIISQDALDTYVAVNGDSVIDCILTGEFRRLQGNGAMIVYDTCLFIDADLSECDIAGCVFDDCTFQNVGMRDCYGASDATFTNCIGLYSAGKDERAYHFVGVHYQPALDNEWVEHRGYENRRGTPLLPYMITAGCRWFNSIEADYHWRDFRKNSEAVRLIEDIATYFNTPGNIPSIELVEGLSSMTPADRLARCVLLFYLPETWDGDKRKEWALLTGDRDVTTKTLGDLARELLARKE